MKKIIELFVPGRLCLFGEHSDWAGRLRSINNEIVEGHAIVTGIEQGIHAFVKESNKLVIIDDTIPDKFEIEMDSSLLENEAKNGGYYSYLCGVALYVLEHYNVGGLEIHIDEITLPIKKGLSSSAAICVLVARAFNQIYNLQLNTVGEMQVAYYGENKTPSRCGRLDQACAFGVKPVSMIFDGDDIKVEKLNVGQNFYWVFADLMSKKDTKKILSDLNSCYPFAQNDVSKNVQKYLGELNKKYNARAIEYFKNGDIEKMGALMNQVQEDFDKFVAPACPKELMSPILHEVLKNEKIKEFAFGGKGVGSQGDGTVQFLAKNKDCQINLAKYLKEELGMDSYILTIKKYEEVKKAIIPIAGMGTRMYPITKIIRKDFLPVYDKGMVKPALAVLLEELYDAGIEEIVLVIDKEDREICEKLFNSKLSDDLKNKLSKDMLEYESKLNKIGKRIKYVYQEKKLGLGHAVFLCKEFIKDEPFLLLLGDQIYSSNDYSCVQQVINNYKVTGKSTLAATTTSIKDVHNYGIMAGDNSSGEGCFEIIDFVEKPSSEYAEQYLGTKEKNGNINYYSVFGIYLLNSEIFDILENMVKEYNPNFGEIQITTAINTYRKKNVVNAFIPSGTMYDIGTPKNYISTIKNYK